jgi:transcriptional regulator with XRE-family HTH domain
MNPIITANKLRTLRNIKGLTPEQVSEKAQLNLKDYKALELGKTAVSVEKLEKACEALGIDFKEWFENDKSNVFINNGEVKGGSGILSSCENCYFYERNEEDTEMLATLATLANSLAEKLDDEILARKIEQVLRKNLDNLEDKK